LAPPFTSPGAERTRTNRPTAGIPGSVRDVSRPRRPGVYESIDGGLSGFHTFIRPPVGPGRLIADSFSANYQQGVWIPAAPDWDDDDELRSRNSRFDIRVPISDILSPHYENEPLASSLEPRLRVRSRSRLRITSTRSSQLLSPISYLLTVHCSLFTVHFSLLAFIAGRRLTTVVVIGTACRKTWIGTAKLGSRSSHLSVGSVGMRVQVRRGL